MTKGEAAISLPFMFTFAGYLEMKKIFTWFTVLLILAACMPMTQKQDTEPKNKYIILKDTGTQVDLCDTSHLPKYPMRPQFPTANIQGMSEKEMDAKIKAHIMALENHIDFLENVIMRTRQRVELCR